MVADAIQANASLRRYALKVSLVYAAVVTTGLIGSIRLLFWEAADEGALARLLAIAGVGFVALSGLLLYLALMRRPSAPVPAQEVHGAASLAADRFAQWSVAGTVVVLVGVILANVAYTQFRYRQEIVAQTATTADTLARVIEEQVRGSIDAVDVTLSSVARAMQILPGRDTPRDREIHALLRANLAHLPHVRAIWILDADGNMVHDSDDLPGSYNLSDRAYFKVQRGDPALGLYVDPPIISRLGVWFMGTSRRINKADGSFGGIVAAAIEPQYFEKFYSALDVGKTGSLSMLRPDGTLIVRTPALKEALGKVASPTPAFVAMAATAPAGDYRFTSSVDGVERRYAYRRVEGRPLVVLVGLSEAERLQGWRDATVASSVAALALSAVLAAAGALILRARTRRDALNRILADTIQRQMIAATAGKVGLWDWDLQTNQVHYSPEWKHQLGYADDEIKDEFSEWKDRVHPDDLERALKTVSAFRSEPWPLYQLELRLRHKDGSYRQILARADLICDERGQAHRMMGSHIDITERREAEQSLRDSEAMLNATFDQAAVGIAHVGLDGRWLRINRKLCEIVGYSAEELVDRTFQDITHPDDLDTDLGLVKRLLDGEIDSYELGKRYIRKDGSTVWIDLTVALVRDEAKQPQFFISVVNDVDARHRAEQALAMTRDRLEGIVESALDAIVSVDEDLRIVLFNPAAEALFGWPAEAMMGESLDRLLPEEHRAEHGNQIRRFLSGSSTSRRMGAPRPVRGLRRDGTQFPLEASISQLTMGARHYATVILRDITERESAERELRESEVRYRQLFEGNPHPMWIRDIQTLRCLQVNDAALRQFGYSREEFMALPADSFVAPGLGAELRDILASGTVPPAAAVNVWRLRLKGGGLIEAEVTWQPIVIDGRPAMVALAHDVTDQRRATREVLQSRESLRALLQRLRIAQEEERTRVAREVHDQLGQQLTAMKIDLRWIEYKLSEPTASQSIVPVLERVVSASELIDQTIATVQALAAELRPMALDQLGLPAALAQRLRQFQLRAGTICSLKCDEDFPDLPRPLANDLFYVFQEALTNVARHAGAGHVIVRLQVAGDLVRLEIEDDGMGTDGSRQADTASLGLLGMRERVRQYGGTLELEPVLPHGTRVVATVSLAPVAPADGGGSAA